MSDGEHGELPADPWAEDELAPSYAGPDRRRDFTAEEVRELRVATNGLVEQVGTLSLAIQTVNHLHSKQQEQDRKLGEVLATAEEQRDLSGVVLSSLSDIDTATSLSRWRFRIIVVVVLVSLLLAAALGSYFGLENRRITREVRDNCVARRQAVIVTIQRERSLADSDIASNRAVHLKSVQGYEAILKNLAC